MSVTVRFAPSPTGRLHVGNARTALINWLFARAHAGRFVLRLDDTDIGRSDEAHVTSIQADLRWLGLDWDLMDRQSAQLPSYHAAFERLREAGRVYACYETPEELEYKRRRLLARGRPPIYDRSALALDDAARAKLEAEGRKPHWRFRLNADVVAWDDLVRGPQHLNAARLSDPVLVRGDGTFLYMLPSAVDDIRHGITHVIRGEDHVDNTAIQIQVFAALGHAAPAFAHLPLLSDLAGKGLSKRLGSVTLDSLAEAGIEPMALAAYLAGIGTAEPPEPAPTLGDLARSFDIGKYGRATPKFDEGQLWHLNARLLQNLPWEAVADRFDAMGMEQADPAFWEAVRPNLERFEDVRSWYTVCYEDILPVIDDPGFARTAADRLPPEPWGQTTWAEWTSELRDATGRKGRALFRPLRLALTAEEHGPELKALLPLIGRRRALERLTALDARTSQGMPPLAHPARMAQAAEPGPGKAAR
ncbi:MAG: glutamate--tRNA ligase [Rhodospirillales bacterium]|nr:MAG: glutamate--tRNA ligase [Rhodospirillales bacterium]